MLYELIEAIVKYDDVHIPKTAECPKYKSILIKGHAYNGLSVDDKAKDCYMASKICGAVTLLLVSLKNILDCYPMVECYVSKGYFYYKNNSNNKNAKVNFEPSLNYRVDSIVFTLDYLARNYADYVKVTYEKEIESYE